MFLQEKVNEINNKLRSLENISNIVIWGAGIHTCKLFERTNLLSYAINSIVDMDERKQGRFCFGFIIKNPQEMIWEEIGGGNYFRTWKRKTNCRGTDGQIGI